MSRDIRLFLTCEHAGNHVPAEYAPHFVGAEAALADHWGWDPGALGLARRLAERFGCPLRHGHVSRLVVELNRSVHGHDLFSRHVRALPWPERQEILERHYWPFRRAVEGTLGEWLREGATVVHVSVHSFTPVWNGETRACDVALLFDPDHPFEGPVSAEWLRRLGEAAEGAVIRANYPYRGVDDSFPTHLRRIFPRDRYAGIEVEVNQGLRDADGEFPARVAGWVGDALARVLDALRAGAVG